MSCTVRHRRITRSHQLTPSTELLLPLRSDGSNYNTNTRVVKTGLSIRCWSGICFETFQMIPGPVRYQPQSGLCVQRGTEPFSLWFTQNSSVSATVQHFLSVCWTRACTNVPSPSPPSVLHRPGRARRRGKDGGRSGLMSKEERQVLGKSGWGRTWGWCLGGGGKNWTESV